MVHDDGVADGPDRAQVRVERVDVGARDPRVEVVRHRRVHVLAVLVHAGVQRAVEVVARPAADAGVGVGRDVGRQHVAERRVEAQAARERRAAACAVWQDTQSPARARYSPRSIADCAAAPRGPRTAASSDEHRGRTDAPRADTEGSHRGSPRNGGIIASRIPASPSFRLWTCRRALVRPSQPRCTKSVPAVPRPPRRRRADAPETRPTRRRDTRFARRWCLGATQCRRGRACATPRPSRLPAPGETRSAPGRGAGRGARERAQVFAERPRLERAPARPRAARRRRRSRAGGRDPTPSGASPRGATNRARASARRAASSPCACSHASTNAPVSHGHAVPW